MSGGGVPTAAQRRLLRPAGVRAVDPHRRHLVGRLLDQPPLGPGARLARRHHRTDDDHHHHVVGAQLPRLVPDGDGRLVRDVHAVRVRRAARVRVRQRAAAARAKADTARRTDVRRTGQFSTPIHIPPAEFSLRRRSTFSPPISSLHTGAPGKHLRSEVTERKGSRYSITERRVPELIPVLGSRPAGDVSHKPDGRLLPLLSARPAVTPATLLPILLLGEQRHDECEQFA